MLLGYPLQVTFGNLTAATRRNDLLYYAPLTDPDGPSMTWSMHSIGFRELGDLDRAGSFLNQSIGVVTQAPFGVWSETINGGCPLFVTGAGGFLQAVVYGYPGLRLNDTALTFTRPAVIDGSTSLKLRGMAYLGNRLDVAYDASSITFEVQPAGACDESVPAAARRAYAASRKSTAASDAVPAMASSTCQRGRVMMRGAAVAATQLVVIAASDGVARPLAPGKPVTLPVGDSFVVTAQDAAEIPLGRAGAALGASLGTAFDVTSY